MGVRASKALPAAMCWIDFEGGLKTPLWDAGMVIDTMEHTSGIRLVQFTNKEQRSKVRNSVPPKVFDRMQENEPWELQYSLAKDGTWHVSDSRRLRATIAERLPSVLPVGCTLAAWNMKGHDVRVLRNHLTEKVLNQYHLVDPLLWFRKHVALPSNTLGSARAGTPRAVFKAGDYSYLGKVHTAFVDALHMRDVTRKASYAVHHMDKDGNIDIDDVHNKADMAYNAAVRKAFDIASQPEKHLEDGEAWMWSSVYWTKEGILKPDVSKEFKTKFVQWIRQHEGTVDKRMLKSINATKKQETMRKYLSHAWTVV